MTYNTSGPTSVNTASPYGAGLVMQTTGSLGIYYSGGTWAVTAP